MNNIVSTTQSTLPVSDLNPDTKITETMGNMEKSAPYSSPAVPVVDQYVHQQAPESIGLYHIAQDESGIRDIIFDAPADADKLDKKKSTAEPETTTADTNNVDVEIRKLKERLEALKQKLAQVNDNPQQQAQLQKQISQTESELRIKDTDSYRRQHTLFL